MNTSEAVRQAVRRTALASGVPELVSDPATLQDVLAVLPEQLGRATGIFDQLG